MQLTKKICALHSFFSFWPLCECVSIFGNVINKKSLILVLTTWYFVARHLAWEFLYCSISRTRDWRIRRCGIRCNPKVSMSLIEGQAVPAVDRSCRWRCRTGSCTRAPESSTEIARWTAKQEKQIKVLWAGYSSWRHLNMARPTYGQAYLYGCTFVQRNMGSW